MVTRVDGEVVSPDALWWPELNFDQFRWPGRIGDYELEIPRADFTERLEPVYRQCIVELRADDLLDPDQQSPLKAAGYPSLQELPDHPAAFFEAVRVYLWDDVFGTFLRFEPSAARFMINSIEAASALPAVVLIRGRGYHGAPGFALQG